MGIPLNDRAHIHIHIHMKFEDIESQEIVGIGEWVGWWVSDYCEGQKDNLINIYSNQL